jgi:hypothetical protein
MGTVVPDLSFQKMFLACLSRADDRDLRTLIVDRANYLTLMRRSLTRKRGHGKAWMRREVGWRKVLRWVLRWRHPTTRRLSIY